MLVLKCGYLLDEDSSPDSERLQSLGDVDSGHSTAHSPIDTGPKSISPTPLQQNGKFIYNYYYINYISKFDTQIKCFYFNVYIDLNDVTYSDITSTYVHIVIIVLGQVIITFFCL